MMTTPSALTQANQAIEVHIRQEIKQLFDAQATPDMLYQMYSTIDRNITEAIGETKETTKTEILRISEFFNSLSFFESVYDFVSDAYVRYDNLRHGFLTNGVLFKTDDIDNPKSIRKGYTIAELASLYHKTPSVYEQIIEELTAQTKNARIDGTWYFWPGCEMKIPSKARIILDTTIAKSKFVATKKKNSCTAQLVLEEKPYQLEVSMLGDCDLVHIDQHYSAQQLQEGFFTLSQQHKDFSEVVMELHNAEDYEYTLFVPYQTARTDIKTNLKMISANHQVVDEFVATCT